VATDDASGSKPAPVVLRIKLRYDDVDTMVARFAPNVGKSGLFLPTKSLQPVGAELKFELRIADDTPVLVGLGRVKAARAPDPALPRAAFGMAIELMRVTRESREVILRMLERRRQLGLPELGIPMPGDIDAARRSEVVDTQVKDTASAPVPTPVPSLDSGPAESLLTAPRRPSGPLAVAKLNVVEALAPEPPRRKRPAIHEVIESASGPIVSVVSVPGLDAEVDVPAVLARARALAGGSLDAELEALREVAAAPLEISIEAASAELARQLGGTPVARRDRSQRWEPPPRVESAPAPAPEPAPPAEPEKVAKPQAQIVSEPAIVLDVPPVADEPAVITAVDEAPLPQAAVPGAVPVLFDAEDEESAPVHAPPGMIHDDADPRAFTEPPPDDEEVAPEQIADEIHTLGDGDLEEVEHTAIGVSPATDGEAAPEDEPEPEDDAFAQHAYPTEPAVAAELAASLDAQLAEAEAEADQDDLGISGAYALPQAQLAEAEAPADDVPEDGEAEEELEEVDDFEILAEADADDEDLLRAHAEQDAPDDLAVAQEPAYAAPAPEPYYAPPPAAPMHLDDDDPEAELEERPIHRRPRRPSVRLDTPAPRPSQADFVSRLDLSDEFEAVPPGATLDPREVSAGHALAAFDEPEPDDLDRDSQYTVAERTPPPELDLDDPRGAFPRAESIPGFDKSDVIATRAPARKPTTGKVPLATAPPGPVPGDEGYDLETALEALDVDLDDLSVPGTQPPAARLSPKPRVPTKVPTRATTDDGVLIDFDDDD